MIRGAFRAVLVAGLLSLLVVPSASGSVSSPDNGRYAGAGVGVFVWLDVKQHKVKNPRIDAEFGSGCDYATTLVGTDAPSSTGRWSLSSIQGGTTYTLKGRFRSSTRLTGHLTLVTTDACPADTYTFDYRARRIPLP